MKNTSFTKVYKTIKETVKGDILSTKIVDGHTFTFIKQGAFINICYNSISFWIDGGFKWCTLEQAEQALIHISQSPDYFSKIDKFCIDSETLPYKEKEVKESIPMCKYNVCINGVVSTKRKKIISTFELDGLEFIQVSDSIVCNGCAVSRIGSKSDFISSYTNFKYTPEKVLAWIEKEYKL